MTWKRFRPWAVLAGMTVACLPSARAVKDAFGNATDSRTVQDETIDSIENARAQAQKDTARANRQRLEQEQAQHKLDGYFAEKERLERQRQWAAAEERERRARELHQAAVAAEDEHWRKVSAGDPEALFVQARRHLDAGSYSGAVSNLLDVRGARQPEAWKRAYNIMREHEANYYPHRLIDVAGYVADHGDPYAARFVGDQSWARYQRSRGAGDLEGAVKYYSICAPAGDRPSRLILIKLLTTHQVRTLKVSSEDFRQWCERHAEAGDLPSQASLSRQYYNGWLRDADEVAGLAWAGKVLSADPARLDQSSKALWAECADRYALNQYSGKVLPKDEAAARALWQRAASLGGPAAMYNLGVLEDKAANSDAAVGWWEKAAHGGSVPALRRLTQLYNSPESPRYDTLKAMEWMEALADYDSHALLPLAAARYSGSSIFAKDEKLGHDLFEKALQEFQSEPFVRWQIGAMKLAGSGGYRVDPQDGLRLLRGAFEDGEAHAARALQLAYTRGVGVRADAAEAEKWKKLADDAHAPPLPN